MKKLPESDPLDHLSAENPSQSSFFPQKIPRTSIVYEILLRNIIELVNIKFGHLGKSNVHTPVFVDEDAASLFLPTLDKYLC